MSAPSTIVAQACCPVLPCLFVRANLILQQQGAHDAAHILLSHWSFIRRMFVFLFAKNRTMLGELTDQQMDELLKKQVTGRLGCHADGLTYVVPVNYTYDGKHIYAHSAEGMKVNLMRKNPEVCFEVDNIENIFKWESVILWGRFEEIEGVDEQQRVMQGIIHRLMPLAEKPDSHPSHGITANDSDIGTRIDLVIYRIVITKRTGRFERD